MQLVTYTYSFVRPLSLGLKFGLTPECQTLRSLNSYTFVSKCRTIFSH